MKKISNKSIVYIILLFILVIFLVFYGKVSFRQNKNLSGSVASSISDGDVEVAPVYFITGVLKQLSFNDEVNILEKTLVSRGYNIVLVDNFFGPETTRAVRNFQFDNGIPNDGVVDGRTRDLINEIIAENERIRAEEELRQRTEEMHEQGLRFDENQAQDETKEIELIATKTDNTLFKDYECKNTTKGDEKLYIFTGETIDESKNANSVYSLSDVWSTTDGVNWEKIANNTDIGKRWETMVVKVGDTAYSFGGKYESNSSSSDNEIYKSKDMVNWTYVGQLPQMSHLYDRSVVYFKDKFWLIASEEGRNGVWSSEDGSKWNQILTNTPWTGYGTTRRNNSWGYYDSNSLGAYVINGKMWYIVSNASSNSFGSSFRIYSTSDGKNWKDEGPLLNSKDSTYIQIFPNVNPAPVYFKDKVWIASSNSTNTYPMVINTSNGKDWNVVSTNDSVYSKFITISDTKVFNFRNYPSFVSFKNKLWSIGGWDIKNSSDSPNDNSGDIWSSEDGNTWTKIQPKGVTFPGPADRWLAGSVSIAPSGNKASNLEIQREYNATGYFTGQDEKDRLLGKWTFVSREDGDKTDDIVISSLSFLGNDYKDKNNNQFSSLESLRNIKIYANDEKVAEIESFEGPFYDSTLEYAISKTIKFDKEVTVGPSKSLVFTIVADFETPKYKEFEMRTWLNGVGFKDQYSTPCNVYSEDYSEGRQKIPGRNIYFKQ